MSILSKFRAGLGMRDGEVRPTLLLLAYSFLIGGSLLFFDTASYALFLDQFDARSLPSIYMVVALVIPVIGTIYSRLDRRLTKGRLLQGTLAFLVISTFILRAMLGLSPSRWLLFGSLIWGEVLYALLGLGFWALAGFIFDIRQGKRLFGLIGAGGLAAGIVSGLSVPGLVNLLGTTNLILVSAVFLTPCSLLLFILAREYPERFAGANEHQKRGDNAPGQGLQKDRYVGLIMALTVFSFLIYYFIEFIFLEQAEGRFIDEIQLANFLGLFLGATRAINLGARVFVSGRLLNLYGLKFGLLSLPATLTVVVAVTAASQTLGLTGFFFWLVVVLKLANEVLLDTIYTPSTLLLYQPLALHQRLAVQATRDAIIGPIATGLSGALLLLYLSVETLTSNTLMSAIFIVLVTWLGTTVLASREYAISLMKALKDRLLSGDALVFDDASSIAVLREKLRSPLIDETIYALDLLERTDHPNLGGFLSDLLDHPAAEVRRQALLRLEQRRFEGALSAIDRCLEVDSSPTVQAAALQALCAVNRPEITARVIRYLGSSEPQVKLGAMVGLLRYDNGRGAALAGRALEEMVGSPLPEERVLAAQIIGLAGKAALHQPLATLLGDEDLQVRRTALKAAGQLKHPHLWSIVVAALASQTVHRSAANALAAGGGETLAALQNLLSDKMASPHLIRRSLHVIGRLGEPKAYATLVGWLDHPDLSLRSQALRSLRRCGYQAQGPAGEKVRDRIKAEVAGAAYLLVLAKDLDQGENLALLQSALALALDQTRSRILDLLAFVYEPQAIQRVERNLAHPSRRQQAYAIELLDIIVTTDLKPYVFPLLENLPDSERLRQLQRLFPQTTASQNERLRELITSRSGLISVWTRATALYTVQQTKETTLFEVVKEALDEREELLRETALWTLCRMNGANRGYCFSQLANDPSPTVRSALAKWQMPGAQEEVMLSTIEKVIILKSVDIFAHVPGDVLADAARLLTEVRVSRGETIIHKGEIGDSMYIIVSGQVRVHDGDRTLNLLRDREIFGEMALLDTEPRSASVTAESAALLLCLDQALLYELMDDYSEVARAIIRVLSGKLRERVNDLGQLSLGRS